MSLCPPQVQIRAARGAAGPIVATIPHSGRFLPLSISSAMMPRHAAWLKNTDWYLDSVYSFLPEVGVTTIIATHSRYVVDVNRHPETAEPGAFFSSAVPTHTDHGESVYATPPTSAEALERVRAYHAPFHRSVAEHIGRTVATHGRAVLLDLHSFMGPGTHDICVGNARGRSASQTLLERISHRFAEAGFDVGRNEPFSGGYIVRAHAHPPTVNALLLELRYPNYLNCERIDEPEQPAYEEQRISLAAARLRPVFEQLAATVQDA